MDAVDKPKRLVLLYVLFLQGKEPDDTEAVEELNKNCSSTLYNMKKKLMIEHENRAYGTLLNRGYRPTIQEEFEEWMKRLKN